ncbi:hypothetical protein [Microbacterium proteolyticum]|uniref:hypothetical protein n=1 Tax=Microbacterium proteolyticum TaxID=1572644 RepID=UPI001FAD2BF4|nr:hypothetical protein [Microbacterium proteolyticum]MCI9858917.1 hypothetical protein [Microbacterium proteolyticum]
MALWRKSIALTVAGAALVVVAGCTPTVEPAPPASASASASVSEPTQPPIPYAVPTSAPGEIARAVFEVVDGVNTTDTVLSDAFDADDALTVSGQCEGGDWMRYILRDSTPDGDGADLTSGTFRCDSAATQANTYVAGAGGTVQVVLTVAEGTERAWVTVEK